MVGLSGGLTLVRPASGNSDGLDGIKPPNHHRAIASHMPKDTQISKFMSMVLRHAPQKAGLSLGKNGWADFDALCAVIRTKFGASAADVLRIFEENPKKRFAFDGNRIRAMQGHTIEVDLGLPLSVPPAPLYHGTKEEFLASILREA